MLNAAIYVRLSREDGDNAESSSIISQKELLMEYAAKNNYKIFDIYTDDGYSGTDFNRPDFSRMILDIEKGFIKVVIVKDLSRLGRNYLKSGYYLEEYFPAKKVKFIAVNDNYISDEGDNEFAPFKNIMNEWYAKDISKKIKTTHKLHQEKGIIPTGKLPLYGYRYDDQRARIPDIEASEVVRYIFNNYAKGNTVQNICNELRKKKIIVPGYWMYKHYNYMEAKYSSYDDKQKYGWNRSMIYSILNQEEYNGDLILRKTLKVSFKNHKILKIDDENRMRFPKYYRAIVDEATIERVRTIQKSHVRSQTPVELNIYKGIAKCKNCKKALVLRKYQKGYYYLCHRPECKDKAFIKLEMLNKIVNQELSSLSTIFKNSRQSIFNYVRNYIKSKNIGNNISFIDEKEITKIEIRLKKIDSLILKLFDSETDGTISKDTYNRMLKNYTYEQKELENRLKLYSRNINVKNITWEGEADETNKFIKMITSLPLKDKLDFIDISSIIEFIYVHGSKKNLQVRIAYRNINTFLGEFNCHVSKK